MRIIILFTCIALMVSPLFSLAQRGRVKRKGVKPIDVTRTLTDRPLYSIKQFEGKWQEIYRTTRENNSAVDFTDTLFFNFYNDSDVSVRDGINLSVKGSADIGPGNMLTTAGDQFIIKSFNKTKAVLDDGEKYFHTIMKMKNFWYETLPTDSVVPEKFDVLSEVNLSAIFGKWNVYRRSAKPGSIANDELLITTLTIEDKSNSKFNSEVAFYQSEKTEVLPCSVTVDGNKINIVTTKHSWQMNVYKATKEEFIFGGPGLIYYCKRVWP
jgi:hypothetical protein